MIRHCDLSLLGEDEQGGLAGLDGARGGDVQACDHRRLQEAGVLVDAIPKMV
jgi:hypothetical protein